MAGGRRRDAGIVGHREPIVLGYGAVPEQLVCCGLGGMVTPLFEIVIVMTGVLADH